MKQFISKDIPEAGTPGWHNVKILSWGYLMEEVREAFAHVPVHVRFTVAGTKENWTFEKMKPSDDNAGRTKRLRVIHCGNTPLENEDPLADRKVAEITVRMEHHAPQIKESQKAQIWVNVRHVDKTCLTIGAFAKAVRRYVRFPSFLNANFSQADPYVDLPYPLAFVEKHIVVNRHFKLFDQDPAAEGNSYEDDQGAAVRIYEWFDDDDVDEFGNSAVYTRIELALRTQKMRRMLHIEQGATKVHHLELLLTPGFNLFHRRVRWFKFKKGTYREKKWRKDFRKHRKLVRQGKMTMQEVYVFLRENGIKPESWLVEDKNFDNALWDCFRPYLVDFLSDLHKVEKRFEKADAKWQMTLAKKEARTKTHRRDKDKKSKRSRSSRKRRRKKSRHSRS